MRAFISFQQFNTVKFYSKYIYENIYFIIQLKKLFNMKNFLLILITCITISFTSCNTNYFDDYEKEETTTIMTRVVQDPLHPIINGENVYGNWIQLFYIHPTQYIGKWNIYLQYQSGAEWKYYNPNGGNTPYIVLSGEALNSYIIPFSGNYLPKGNPVIRICVDEYAPNGSRSTWSEPYQLKGYNQCGLIPAPNFDGFGSSVLELYGTLRPLISGVHSAKIIFAINGIFENSPITKQYKIEWIPGTYYFSTKLGIEPNQNYTLSYTVTYYDYTGKALFPIDKGSYSINVGYSNYSSLKIFD